MDAIHEYRPQGWAGDPVVSVFSERTVSSMRCGCVSTFTPDEGRNVRWSHDPCGIHIERAFRDVPVHQWGGDDPEEGLVTMSENKKHTPGPWHFAPDVSRQGARLIYGPDRYLIADAGRIYGRSEEETTANARLIAKSPELLALVERFAFIAEAMPKPEIGQWNWPQLAAEARALIAAVNV